MATANPNGSGGTATTEQIIAKVAKCQAIYGTRQPMDRIPQSAIEYVVYEIVQLSK
jgi:hypothetical protein